MQSDNQNAQINFPVWNIENSMACACETRIFVEIICVYHWDIENLTMVPCGKLNEQLCNFPVLWNLQHLTSHSYSVCVITGKTKQLNTFSRENEK